MKRILVYGDSNSWGFPADGSCVRKDDRWPKVFERHLSNACVIEECLPGRTTVHDDPEFLGETCNGLRPLKPIILSQAPISAVLIFLGTNDLKTRFSPTAQKVANNVGRLVSDIRETGGRSSTWEDPTPPDIFMLCPPALSERADDPNWERHLEWSGARRVSQGLWPEFQRMGYELEVPVFETDHFVEGGADDPIHWTSSSHLRLGQAVAHWLTPKLV